MNHYYMVDTTQSPYSQLCPIPFNLVQLEGGFWEPWLKQNREVTLPSQYRLLEDTGRLDHFRRAAGHPEIPFRGKYYNDSDVYKWLEAACWALAPGPDEQLRSMVDTVVGLIEAAQSEDGYLDTYFTHERASQRWTNIRDMHELYCAGHLIQAAVAHHRVTETDRLLNVARRLADHIWTVFGPQGKPSPSGHPEIELALVELYRETNEERYLELGERFLDQRGQGLIGGSDYHIDHQPFRELKTMTGHAVRMLYLCSGAADIYMETGEKDLLVTLERLWKNMTREQMYISGGLGSRHEGEAFGEQYELPNERAYAETCAGIANVMWNWRMLHITPEARYADLLELALYNAALTGISLEGTSYYYVNPLANDGTHRRLDWYECACCPTNIIRLLATLPAYLYSRTPEGVWLHQYTNSRAHIPLPNESSITLSQKTRYPWEGEIEIEILERQGQGELSLFLRIPGWIETLSQQPGALVSINGEKQELSLEPGTYAQIQREWKAGDRVCLSLPMPVRMLESHPYLNENVGKVAILRGPILYSAEAVDNPGIDLRDIHLDMEQEPEVIFDSGLLRGVARLRLAAEVQPPGADWEGQLYRPRSPQPATNHAQPYTLAAIPYFAWANRTPGQMRVWLS